LQSDAGKQSRDGRDRKDNDRPGSAGQLSFRFFFFLQLRPARLPAGRIAAALPGEVAARFADEIKPDNPRAEDDNTIRSEAVPDERIRQLMSDDDKRQHHNYEDRFEHQVEPGGVANKRCLFLNGEGIENDQHDGLDGDAAENISRGNVELVSHRSTRCDRDLREIRHDSEQDRAAERFSKFETGREDIGRVRNVNTGDPDDRAGREENE
jgi:hypothetical protein